MPSERGPLLHLSRFVRSFRDHQRGYLESLLSERALALDPELEALLGALEQGPVSAPALLEALQGQVAQREAGARLDMLLAEGMVLLDPIEEQRRFEAALAQPAPLPAVDQVEVTNACPLDCPMCGRGRDEMQRPVGFMEVELFRALVVQIAQQQRALKPLVLHNAGESLLHRRLEELVQIAAAAGLQPELSVNPGYLPVERYLALRDAGLARLVISLDGVSAQTLERVRGAAARGQEALINIEAILRHRERHGEHDPALVIQMLRLAANQHEHDDFLQRYQGLEAQGVAAFLKPLDAETDPALFVPGEVGRPGFCRAPWRTVVVLWDGTVVPCCYDIQGQIALGHLARQTLAEIWQGEPARRLRAQLCAGAPDAALPCARCAHRPDRYQRPPLLPAPFEPLHW